MKPLLTAALWFAMPVLFAAPAGFWRFDDVPGFLEDSSGSGRTLANDGSVVAVTGGPGEGRAASFSGANRLTTGDSPLWHSSKFTIEAYFRSSVVGGSTHVIACHHNNDGNQRGWHLAEALGKLRFAKSTDGSGLASVNAFTIVAGRDYYAAAVVDAEVGSVTMVLRDLTAGTAAVYEHHTIATGTFDANAAFSIGSTGTVSAGSSYFTGVIDDVRFTASALPTMELLEPFESTPPVVPGNPVSRLKADGYKGIWFELGQKSTYGDKYSGGLGTYTTNHRPIAVYSAERKKTFFTYGGTTGPNDRHLLIMAGEYDHETHTVTKPTVVMDKNGVDDPHDNACISMDKDGFIWIFVSGRNTSRKGFTYRSAEAYSTDGFTRVSPVGGESYTYPQVWYDPVKGFMHLLTRYNGGRRDLYFRTSVDGVVWSTVDPLAAFGGHYQASEKHDGTVGTFFNRHVNGNVDTRTDLYYMQTADWGETWTTAGGTPLTLPLTATNNPALVWNYSAEGRLMYGIDIAFDESGHPVLFYLTSADYRPGPAGEPRIFHTARWTGTSWDIRNLPVSATPLSTAAHNYATGSLWIDGGEWNIIAPTGADQSLRTSDPMRYWGQGGEIERWKSIDQGVTWTKVRAVTENSTRNHGYVRKPLDGTGRFNTFWADGNPASITESHLYFGNIDGTRYWELPYHMTTPTANPVEVNPPYLRWQKGYFEPQEIADEELGGPGADWDEDGFSNIVEYGRGTNPKIKDLAGNLIARITTDGLGDFLELSYRKNTEAFDLFQKIEASDDLDDWGDVEEELFDISSTANGNVLELSRGHRWVTGLPGDRRFYRMSYELDE